MTINEAEELIKAFSHKPVTVENAQVRLNKLGDIEVVVSLNNGTEKVFTDIVGGRAFALEVAARESKDGTRYAVLTTDGPVEVPVNLRVNRDFGFKNSLVEVACSDTVQAQRFFGGLSTDLDGAGRFWHINFIDSVTGKQYGGELAFETSDEADEFIRRYKREGCPSADSQEFIDLKNEYL